MDRPPICSANASRSPAERLLPLLALPLGLAGGAAALAARPEPAALAPGVVQLRTVQAPGGIDYFLYVPSDLRHDAPLFVTVHGISRNARQHAEKFAALAQAWGVVLAAPRFPAARFPDYQRLGRADRGERADLALHAMVAEVARLTGARGEPMYLFGYSGGGQFVHRYAMAYPERVAAYVVGAAGWYTFPDATLRYPRGMRPAKDLPGVDFDLGRFLAVPGAAFVGERDVHPGTALRKTERVAAQQGASRFERGQRWVEAMNDAAVARGLPAHFEFQSLPRSPHSFARSMRRGDMGARVFARLFGPAPG